MTSRFDQNAQTWDANPSRRALAEAVVNAIRARIPLHARMAALDFGAGTGLVSFGLTDAVARVYALDPSLGMIGELRRKCAESGIANIVPLHAGSIAAAGLEAPVELAVCSMVLHHIPDVAATLRELHAALQPGGWLAIADLMPDQGEFHEEARDVFHPGFDPSALANTLRQAGFTPDTSQIIYEVRKQRPFPVFLLTARRSPAS